MKALTKIRRFLFGYHAEVTTKDGKVHLMKGVRGWVFRRYWKAAIAPDGKQAPLTEGLELQFHRGNWCQIIARYDFKDLVSIGGDIEDHPEFNPKLP